VYIVEGMSGLFTVTGGTVNFNGIGGNPYFVTYDNGGTIKNTSGGPITVHYFLVGGGGGGG